MERGFSIVEVLIVMAIIAILMGISIPQMHYAKVTAQSGAVIADAKQIYTAFKQYHVDNSGYYPTIQLNDFEPLRSENRYNGNVSTYLLSGQADAFDSPDDQGADQEFWIEMTLETDPTVRFLIVDSDDAPLSGGAWLDGVYRFENGVLKPL